MQTMGLTNKVIPDFLSGGGEMGQRIRDFDWESTPLGSFDTWPHSLRTCIRIMLTSRQPIWIGWGKDLIKFYNDPYKAIVGGKHPWALGQPASVVWKDIWKDIEPLLKKVMEQDEGTYVESQLLIMERNGYPEETYYTFSYTPIPGDDGKTEGMFCANTDDTDKIIGERQLTTLTELGKKLVDCRNNEEVIRKSIHTLGENPYDFPFAIFRTINGAKASVVGSTDFGPLATVIPAEIDLNSDHVIAGTLKNAIASHKPQLLHDASQKIGPLPTGAWQVPPDKIIALPIFQAGLKDPFGVLVIGLNPYRLFNEKYGSFVSLVADQIATSFADVYAFEAERKRAEALAEVDRAKTAFFSNISHEFRTPLTLMLAPIEDVLNDPDTIPVNQVRMDVAHRNVLRLLKLVNNLLDFSRIEAGRMEAGFEKVDLATLTKDIASTFQSAIEKAGMKLVIECNNLSEAAYVDVDMWEKIVLNLLSNALKYTHEGQITVLLQQQDSTVLFSVKDTGIGIPANEIDKIFDRFHRVQNTGGRSQEGTGIGLSLVQELVKLHDGTIRVSSKVNEGTTFTITLPLGDKHLNGKKPKQQLDRSLQSRASMYVQEAVKWVSSPEEPLQEMDEPAQQSFGNNKPKLLLADDNPDMRDYVRRLLSINYHVTAVSNGKLALDKAKEMQPDIILSDVMMPEMDGFELVKRLKEHPETKYTPVILLSARAGEEAIVEGLETGADDYLVKPFSARELVSRVESNLKIAQSRITAFRQLYKLFMDAPVAIAILRGEEQRFELANEYYLEIAGKKDVVGKTFEQAFPELKETGVRELLDGVLHSGEPFIGRELELVLERNKKMETAYFNFVYSPLEEQNGIISGVMVVATDVTNMVNARKVLKQNEERLEREVQQRTQDLSQANKALERSNKELEQYAYVTSHDLQEPLRKIQTYANLLYERNADKLDEKSQLHYSKVMEAARRMVHLIRDLLDYSRLSKQEEFSYVSLDEIVKQVQNDFEVAIQQKQAVIKSDPLPEVKGINSQLHQLFGNLISNALKFTSKDRLPVIDISSHTCTAAELHSNGLPADRDYFKITVKDNGIGFDSLYADKIFEIFQQLNDRHSYEGTGIGLALCKRIVVRHQGVIYAESEEGKGATFTIILPQSQKIG